MLGKILLIGLLSFHSISFPSEWGVHRSRIFFNWGYVSIQLVSPASGEVTNQLKQTRPYGFPFN